jgi:hypothetical protein
VKIENFSLTPCCKRRGITDDCQKLHGSLAAAVEGRGSFHARLRVVHAQACVGHTSAHGGQIEFKKNKSKNFKKRSDPRLRAACGR